MYTVCGEASSEGSSAGGQGHTVKWDLFQKELERWRSLGFHNSLQYENEKNNNGLTMTKKNGLIDEIENWVWVVYKGFLVSSTLSYCHSDIVVLVFQIKNLFSILIGID